MKLSKSIIPKGYGWTIESTNDVESFDIKNIKLHLEPEQEQGYIKGEVLAGRMKGKGLSANVLDYLLEHQELIPKEWKDKIVFFWGTVYCDSGGYLCIRYLLWGGSRWDCSYRWLGRGWDSDNPAAVSASTQDLKTQPSLEPLSLALAIETVKKAGYKIIKEM